MKSGIKPLVNFLSLSHLSKPHLHLLVSFGSESLPILHSFMTSQQDSGQSLPKFGEWDVNNPSSIDFSVMFSKARDEKKANVNPGSVASPVKNDNRYQQKETNNNNNNNTTKSKWFCCG